MVFAEESFERQDEMNKQTRTRITQVGRWGSPDTELDRALEFYPGKFGFGKRLDVFYGDGERWVEVARQERRRRSGSFLARGGLAASRPVSASRPRTRG